MKTQLNFMDSFKIVCHWLIEHNKNGLITICSFCHSSNIIREGYKEVKVDGKLLYKASYKCLKCNAKANAFEDWSK